MIAILLAAVLIGSYLRFGFGSKAASWFNDNWHYRRAITFTNSGSTVTDQKVKVDINTASAIDPGAVNFNTQSVTFTPAMAKRNGPGPFATGLLLQGDYGVGTNEDKVSFPQGTQISGNFYQNLDTNQGSVVLWWTPEFGSSDLSSGIGYLFHGSYHGNISLRYDYSTDEFLYNAAASGNGGSRSYSITAGTTYQIVFRWDTSNTFDGSKYAALSINNTTTLGDTDTEDPLALWADLYIGADYQGNSIAPGLIEGLTIYRRPLFDGSGYGINVGNGDELTAIYNSGTGKDPTLVTGSWDVVFAMPTNQSAGSLSTTGESWSHPHSSNKIGFDGTYYASQGFMMDGTYTNDGWADEGSPTSVAALATAEKIFGGGYKFISSGTANQGIYNTVSVTAGQDFVVRALGHSDGTCDPQVLITQNDNTEITHLDGTIGSGRTAPDNYIFTFEAPATESIKVKLINTATTGTCYWHQVEVLDNSFTNSSFEAGSGDPWIPTGWTNGGAGGIVLEAGDGIQETTLVHSGSSSFKWRGTSDSAYRGVRRSISITSGTYYSTGIWGQDSGGAPEFSYNLLYLPFQTNVPVNSIGPWFALGNASMTLGKGVNRATTTTSASWYIENRNGGTQFGIVDDVYQFALTPVTLTVTPATLANSTETSGLRVDGRDSATITTGNLTTTDGTVKFNYTPRHSAADAVKFAETSSGRAYVASISTGAGITGTHTGSNNATGLTDSSKSWTTNQWVGYVIYNTTDGSSGTITANAATTVTATLAGGSENDWDTSDAYTILVDRIDLYWSAANTLKMDYCMSSTCSSGTWDATGDIVAGTTYAMQISYDGGANMVLSVDGTDQITLSSIPAAFSTAPTTVYFGSNAASTYQGDATFDEVSVTGIQMQSDCSDVRFTDINGKILDYYYDSTNGACNTESTDFYVLMPTITAGKNMIYMYYGNPTAGSETTSTNFSQTTFSPGAGPTEAAASVGPGPGLIWKLDEGADNTCTDGTSDTCDSTEAHNDGTLGTGSSAPAWQQPSACVSGKCLYFDGSDDVVTVANTVNNIQTVSFWARVSSTSTTEQLIDLNGTDYITSVSGTITANGFGTETIYVDGLPGSTITANTWHYITVTTDTALTGSAIKVGQISTNYGSFFIDTVKIYPYARSADEVKTDYSALSGNAGISAQFGPGNEWMSDGLVGYWKMDFNGSGDAVAVPDSSGNSNNGTTVDGANNTGMNCTGGGKFGYGCDFDGSDDTINLGNPSILNNLTAFTFSAWVYRNAATTYPTVIYDYERVLYFSSDGRITFSMINGNGGNSVAPASSMPAGEWVYVVGTYDHSGDKLARIYVNGKEVSYSSQTAGSGSFAVSSATNWYIGSNNNNGGWFKSKLDEVRIYNRALSVSEVERLYKWAPGPVAYYNFDEGTGGSLQDRSENGNVGTLGVGSAVPTWSRGKYGGALSFDGGDTVSAGSGSTVDDLAVNSSFTVGTWVNIAPTSSSNRTIVTKRNALNVGWQLYIGAGNTLSGLVQCATTDATALTTVNTMNDGAWHYVSMKYDDTGDRKLYLYIDGLDKTNTASQPACVGAADSDAAQDMQIGVNAASQYFVGNIDDLYIYNYARTPEQILEDMNAGHPAIGTPVGSAVLDLRFDEGYGGTAYDRSPSANNGTLGTGSSAPTWTNDGKFGKALSFDGTNDYLSVGSTVTNMQSVSLWVNPSTTTQSIISFDGTGHYISATSGTISATGFGTPTIYVNGKAATTLTASTWNHIVVTTDTSFNGSRVIPGRVNTTYYKGVMDALQIYSFALSADQVKLLYNQGKQTVLGSKGTDPATGNPTDADSGKYCIPGDTSTCRAPTFEALFNEKTGQTAYDTSTAGHSGTLGTDTSVNTEDPVWRSSDSCHSGACLDFTNADGDRVNFGNVNTIDSASQFTITGWARRKALSSGVFLATSSVDNNNRLVFGLLTDGLLYAFARNAGTYTATVAHNTTNWVHLSMVYDGTQSTNATRLKVFIDGIQQTLTFGGVAVPATTANYGATFFTGYEAFNSISSDGFVDQVRVFDYALTPAQIAWDYNRGAPVAWYKFDECSGTTVDDWAPAANPNSFNGNTGTITAGAGPTNTSVGTCSSGNGDEMWDNGTTGKWGASLDFDGSDDSVAVGDISHTDIRTLSFWAKPADTTEKFIELSASDSVEVSSGTVTVTGFGTETVYVDGKQTTSFPDANWHQVTVISDTDITANTVNLGKVGSTYFNGQIDDVRIYNYALTATQVKQVYNEGSSVRFGN